MSSRRRSFAATLSALAGMLFLQATIALAPCGLPGRAAATAMAAAMASMPDCQDAGAASLGVAHCALDDQAAVLTTASLQLPELAAPAALPLRAAPAFVPAAAVAVPPYPAAAGPPPRIRFQSFLL